jgi:glutamyl-tRNA reductase
LGVNHQSAPLPIREKLAFQPTHVNQVLQDLISYEAINEVVVLSTCNRTEIYAATSDITPVKRYLTQQIPTLSDLNLDPYSYTHQDSAVVQHAIRVASGLDSMVMGEPQILGQMKEAYALACEAGTVGKRLQHLFPATFAASKRIRHQTAIGANSVSMAYAIVQLAKQSFSSLADCQVLLIGAGETIELVTTHLYGQSVRRLTIANRTIERAQQLAYPYQAHAIRLAEIPYHLVQADIVITATSHQLPILGKGLLENVLAQRQDRPLFMVDLAVPRNIEPEVSQLMGVSLYNIDHLHTIIETHTQNRLLAAQQAEAMAEMQAEHYMRQLEVLKATDVIRRFRSHLESLRDVELSRALTHLERTQSPKDALAYLARQLTNKILHQPTVQLRHAAYEERVELLLAAKDLFDL